MGSTVSFRAGCLPSGLWGLRSPVGSGVSSRFWSKLAATTHFIGFNKADRASSPSTTSHVLQNCRRPPHTHTHTPPGAPPPPLGPAGLHHPSCVQGRSHAVDSGRPGSAWHSSGTRCCCWIQVLSVFRTSPQEPVLINSKTTEPEPAEGPRPHRWVLTLIRSFSLRWKKKIIWFFCKTLKKHKQKTDEQILFQLWGFVKTYSESLK